jgi:hypothetical protein
LFLFILKWQHNLYLFIIELKAVELLSGDIFRLDCRGMIKNESEGFSVASESQSYVIPVYVSHPIFAIMLFGEHS